MSTVLVGDMQMDWPRLLSQVAPASALAPFPLLALSNPGERSLQGTDHMLLHPKVTNLVTHRSHRVCRTQDVLPFPNSVECFHTHAGLRPVETTLHPQHTHDIVRKPPCSSSD